MATIMQLLYFAVLAIRFNFPSQHRFDYHQWSHSYDASHMETWLSATRSIIVIVAFYSM